MRGRLSRGRVRWVCMLLASSAVLASPHIPKVGDEPPDVLGKAASGEAIHLGDYRGKIVVISFFASWCGPCRNEVPMLMTLQQHATREKVVVISVNWRQGRDEFQHIRKIFGDQNTQITLVSDESGRAGEAYGVNGIPHTVIVGKDGRIVAIHRGYSEAAIPELVDEINGAWRKSAPDDPNGT